MSQYLYIFRAGEYMSLPKAVYAGSGGLCIEVRGRSCSVGESSVIVDLLYFCYNRMPTYRSGLSEDLTGWCNGYTELDGLYSCVIILSGRTNHHYGLWYALHNWTIEEDNKLSVMVQGKSLGSLLFILLRISSGLER